MTAVTYAHTYKANSQLRDILLSMTDRWRLMVTVVKSLHCISSRPKRVVKFSLSLHSPLFCRYGFDYGCIHFVLMSTEHAFDPASPQYTFLEDHLRSVDRSVTPWLVFAGHRPMYIDSTNADPVSGDLTVAKLLRESLEPLLVVSAGCSML